MIRKISILLLLVFPLFILSFKRTLDPEITPLKIGARAPDFNLKGIDGKNYTLGSFSKFNILVVIFTANHCPTAQAYEDRIKELVVSYQHKGVGVVAISPNDPKSIRLDEMGYTDLGDSMQDMIVRAKDKNFNFPYLYDGDDSKASMAYGPTATPHVFIFDKNRQLRYSGRIDDSEKPGTAKVHDTRNAIDELIEGKAVSVATTKTFGCSIKWPEKEGYVKKSDEEWARQPVDLSLIDAEGVKKLVTNESDKLRLINVWATWCGPCITEFPEFVIINRMYRNRDFEFISISADKPAKQASALAFLKKVQASNPNYLYSADNVYGLIEAVDEKWQGALPYTVLVAPGGKILYSKQGTFDPLKMKKLIVEQLGRYY